MIRKALTIAFLAALLLTLPPSSVAAQERRPEQPRPANIGPGRPQAAEPPGSGTNIQIEVNISDYMGTGTPQKKTVSMIVTDGSTGRVRSERSPAGSASLNVDATPRLIADRISLRLVIEYLPPNTEKGRSALLNQSMTVSLQNGKPLMISQGSDPGLDRKVTVEVTASILK